jgi:hypothetical protein
MTQVVELPAQQAWALEFKPQYHKKKKKSLIEVHNKLQIFKVYNLLTLTHACTCEAISIIQRADGSVTQKWLVSLPTLQDTIDLLYVTMK